MIRTSDFTLIAGSASGAAGDVVAVPISVICDVDDPGFHSIHVAVCHDPAVAELDGEPECSPDLRQMSLALNV